MLSLLPGQKFDGAAFSLLLIVQPHMDLYNQRRELFSAAMQGRIAVFSIRIGMIRISVESHAGA